MKVVFSIVLALGIALIVASLVWPRLDDGRSTWTDEKAAAHQEVSARLHGLSFRDLKKEENKKLFDEANSQYRELDAQLQQARHRGDAVGFWLKVVGGVLAGVGGIGFLVNRESN